MARGVGGGGDRVRVAVGACVALGVDDSDTPGSDLVANGVSGSLVNVFRPVAGSTINLIGDGPAVTGWTDSPRGLLVFGSGAFRSYASTCVPSFLVYALTWTGFDSPVLFEPLEAWLEPCDPPPFCAASGVDHDR